MRVLVTGGGGFVGMALVSRLVELGYEVSTFSRNIYPDHQKSGITVFRGDLSKSEEIDNACRGIDTVFHVAAKVGIWGDYSDFYRANVWGTQNVITACQNNGVRKLIYTSSASVIFGGRDIEGADESIGYPSHPISHYASTKGEAEQLVLRANSETLKTISLRPHIVWGPGDTHITPKTIERAKKGRLRKPGKKDNYTDTVHISNLIQAELLAMNKMDENPAVCGRAFFITNGQPVKVWDFLNGIIQAAGLPPVQKRIPEKAAYLAAWFIEKMHLLLRLSSEPTITRFLVLQLCRHHWFDISAARTLLGYAPADLRPGDACRVPLAE